MMRAPDLAAIHAAELTVAQCRSDARDGLRRARLAFRENLARPSTLAVIAGAAGILGFWLAFRRPQRVTPSPAGMAAKTSALGLVLAFIVRHAMQNLPFIVQHVRAARQERAARADPETAESSATGHPAAEVRH